MPKSLVARRSWRVAWHWPKPAKRYWQKHVESSITNYLRHMRRVLSRLIRSNNLRGDFIAIRSGFSTPLS
jgi:hypothetical protein